jgi:hypothetical protein
MSLLFLINILLNLDICNFSIIPLIYQGILEEIFIDFYLNNSLIHLVLHKNLSSFY